MRPRLVRHVRPLVEVADEAGVDVDALLENLGCGREVLREDNTRLPYYQLHWFCEQLIERSGDPEIGLRVAERTDFSKLEFVGHIIQHFAVVAPSLLALVELLARFWTSVSKTARVTLTTKDGRVVIRIVPSIAPPPELYDGCAGACCRLIRQLGGPAAHPLEVRLPRARPARPERYEQFFGTKVLFESEALELVYEHAVLKRPASELDHAVAAAQALAPQVGNGSASWAQQVQARIVVTLADGVPSLSQLARKLGMSSRTLRRRLQQARTRYSELVDEARRQRALALASRGELDVGTIARLTGFAEGSAFARAFRRWTGEQPSGFMRRARERGTPLRSAHPGDDGAAAPRVPD